MRVRLYLSRGHFCFFCVFHVHVRKCPQTCPRTRLYLSTMSPGKFGWIQHQKVTETAKNNYFHSFSFIFHTDFKKLLCFRLFKLFHFLRYSGRYMYWPYHSWKLPLKEHSGSRAPTFKDIQKEGKLSSDFKSSWILHVMVKTKWDTA